MGEIFFIIGAWLVFSGIKDIREAMKIRDTDDKACEKIASDAEDIIKGSSVA